MSEDFSQDQNRKTLRSFYCRDHLWELFEQMTQELGCSMDYLINESMRQYARSRDYSPSQPEEQRQENAAGGPNRQDNKTSQAGGGQPSVDRVDVGQNPEMEHRTFEQVPAVGGGQKQSPNPNQQQRADRGGPGGPPPPPSPNQAGGQQAQQGNWQGGQQGHSPRGQRQAGQAGAQPQGAAQNLFLLFNNNRYPIDQDRFVIGRGSQNTDLTIRDGNISRQHCAIIRRNNTWYLKDLDSTNGVEYRGNRIESKRIEEGDVFYLCDYPLQFTFRN